MLLKHRAEEAQKVTYPGISTSYCFNISINLNNRIIGVGLEKQNSICYQACFM